MCDEEGRSASAEQRIEEWNALIVDPSVKAVFAISGGDYEYEMLPLMDWDLIERNPKWFQGYSDNTTLAFKITAEHDIATSYGGNFDATLFHVVGLHVRMAFINGARAGFSIRGGGCRLRYDLSSRCGDIRKTG